MPDNLSNTCPLCSGHSRVFYHFKDKLYHKCNICQGIFMDHSLRPSTKNEKIRYKEHNNNVFDPGYREFVSPITKAVLTNHKKEDKGLDFGAGPGPVIAKVLKEHGYKIKLYDPFFYDSPELLETTYDYIVCCEVIEHFHHPKKEFALLKRLLVEKGKLYCMTAIYDESIDFHKWSYKNDMTHVFIYQKETLEWINEFIGFADITIINRLILFGL